MKILALTKYGQMGPSSRVRFYQYFPFFEQMGAEIHVEPLLGNDYVRAIYGNGGFGKMATLKAYRHRLRQWSNRKSFDLIWMENEFLHYWPFLFEKKLYSSHPPVVVNYDDAVFFHYQNHANPMVRFLLGRKIEKVMSQAAGVVVGNDFLYQHAKTAGAKHIANIPSVINLEDFPDPFEAPTAPTGDKKLCVGWIGTPNTMKFLNLIQPALRSFQQNNDLKLKIMGVSEFKADGIPVQCYPWTEGGEADFLKSIDVGIMPLEDKPFERGKCGYKLIQYMAGGKPVIASAVGANVEIVRPEWGLLAAGNDDWVNALIIINSLKTEGRLAEMGKKGRKRVEQAYSVQVTANPLYEFLAQCSRHS